MKVVSVTSAKLHLFDIVFDDGTAGSVDKTVWEHSGYHVDSILDDPEWEALQQRSDIHRAKEKALYYLSLRDYGKGELVGKLRRAGIDRALAESTVVRLEELGLINDERYASALARHLSERKLYPKRRIAASLKEKGFSSEVIETALSELPEEETQQALELLIKKGYNGKSGSLPRDKMLAQLARYGFSYSASRRAIELLESYEDDEE